MIASLVVYNEELNLGVLQIPKTASTVFRMLRNYYPDVWKEAQAETLDPDMKMVIILRDPADRYLASANMHFQVEGNKFQHPMSFTDYMIRDQHFCLQQRFIGDMVNRNTDIDYWHYTPTVVQDINDHYGLGLSSELRANDAAERIITGVNEDLMLKYYADDYAFIEATTFVNSESNV